MTDADDDHRHLAAWQQRLAPDLGVLRRYGEEHADELGAVAYDGAGVKISFTGHLDQHRAALTDLVAHPDRLRVVGAASTGEERRVARDELDARLRQSPPGVMAAVGETFEAIEVRLGAAYTALAQELHARFGAAVRLWVGHKAFPVGGETWRSTPLPTSTVDWPDLLAVIVPEMSAVPSGVTVRAEVRFLNRGTSAVRFTSGVVAGGLARVGRDTWAAQFAGIRTLEAYVIDLPPGATGRLPALIGTASVEPDDAPALPAGDYELVAPLNVWLPGDDDPSRQSELLVIRGGSLELLDAAHAPLRPDEHPRSR